MLSFASVTAAFARVAAIARIARIAAVARSAAVAAVIAVAAASYRVIIFAEAAAGHCNLIFFAAAAVVSVVAATVVEKGPAPNSAVAKAAAAVSVVVCHEKSPFENLSYSTGYVEKGLLVNVLAKIVIKPYLPNIINML